MKSTMLLVVLVGALGLGVGCGEKKTASVPGEPDAKLTLKKPSSVTLRRGEMEKIDISISRDNFPGEVAIRFDELPAGVDVVDADNRITGDKGTFTLRASEMAALVEKHACRVTATGQRGVSVSESFDLTVKEMETASGR
jgi:hypothetical protein